MKHYTKNKKEILKEISELPVYYCYEEKPEEPVLNTNLSAENLRKLMILFKTYIEDDKEDIKNNEYVFVSYNTSKKYNENYFNLDRLIRDIEEYNKLFGKNYDIHGIYKVKQLEDEKVMENILNLMYKSKIIDENRLYKLNKKIKTNKEVVLKIIKEIPPEILFPELLENAKNHLSKYNKKLIFSYKDMNGEDVINFLKKMEELNVDSIKIYAFNLDGNYCSKEPLKNEKWEYKLKNVIKNSLFQYFNVVGLVLYSLSKTKNLYDKCSIIVPQGISNLERKADHHILKNLKEFGVNKIYIGENISPKNKKIDIYRDPSYLEFFF